MTLRDHIGAATDKDDLAGHRLPAMQRWLHAEGHRGIPVASPVIAVGIVAKAAVRAVFVDRNEDEVLLEPRDLAVANRLASIDTKLAQLTTMTQITIGVLVVLLGRENPLRRP